MRNKIFGRSRALALLTAAVVILSGCGATAVHKGAARGAQMSVDLDADLQTVIDAQNELYEEQLDIAVVAINDLYLSKQRFYLNQESDSFAAANKATTANQMGPKILTFMSTAMKNWIARHKAFDDLLKEAKTTFAQNTAKIEQDRGKLKALRTKFVALSSPRSREEALKLMIAFAKDVKTDLDRREQELQNATEAPATPTQ